MGNIFILQISRYNQHRLRDQMFRLRFRSFSCILGTPILLCLISLTAVFAAVKPQKVEDYERLDKTTAPLPDEPTAANGAEKQDETTIGIADLLESSDNSKSRQGSSNNYKGRLVTHHQDLVNNVARDICCPITMGVMTEPMLTP